MEEINNKLKVSIDFERKSLEDTQFNPYEVVVASSKYARELNDRARKFFGPAVEIQPRNIAIKSVLNGKSVVVRDKNSSDDGTDNDDTKDV
jgi:hypothetical protein